MAQTGAQTGFNLTIAIPTVAGRAAMFGALHGFLSGQIAARGIENKVEIISLCDNKEMSIGAKRQRLYERARGKFCVQIDDDDTVHPDFAAIINACIEDNPSICGIGYIEHCAMGSENVLAFHSDRWSDWGENAEVGGMHFRYVRTLFFKDPIRTDICRKVGVRDMRYGEDLDFARRLKASGLIVSSIDIPEAMYYYRYQPEPHETKYGFKR